MRLSARVDYALRAAAELAATASGPGRGGEIPPKFLESILLQLRRGGIVHAQRGAEGGYWLARPAEEISLAEVIRVIDGPLAHVRGQRPEQLGYHGPAHALQEVWIALRASEREILELVIVADVAAGTLPARRVKTRNDKREERSRQHHAGGEAQQDILRFLGNASHRVDRQGSKPAGQTGPQTPQRTENNWRCVAKRAEKHDLLTLPPTSG